MALGGQLAPELLVVLDDAVVHDRHSAGAVAMRVGVALHRSPVGRPPRVADTGGHVRGRGTGGLPERFEGVPAQGVAPAPQGVVTNENHPCRVIAAVLEQSQRVQHHLQRISRAGDADDPAHA